MCADVIWQCGFAVGLESLRGADGSELGPAEAVAAIGVTILSLREKKQKKGNEKSIVSSTLLRGLTHLQREEEHRLPVFMLHSKNWLAPESRNILLLLSCRMRIQTLSNILCDPSNLQPRCMLQQHGADLLSVSVLQHLWVWKGHPKDGIMRHLGPESTLHSCTHTCTLVLVKWAVHLLYNDIQCTNQSNCSPHGY